MSEDCKESSLTDLSGAAAQSSSSHISYILVGDEGNESDAIELPVEPSGLMPLSTLQAQFPGATCLKFKHSETGRYRGIKLMDNYLYPPENGWKAEDVYIVTYPKDHKRKAEEEICTTAAGKPKKLEKKCVDLLVQSIPYHLNNQSLKAYFEKFGDIVFCDIKRDANGSSRGFGFIRFSDYEAQEKVLVLRHIIDGRWCDVKIPNSQLMDQVMREGGDLSRGIRSSGGGYDRRIFIGRLNQEISDDTLRTYFSKHGEVLDVYVPHPFRRWAFVTFKDPEIARSLVGRNMIIEDQSVQISYATPPKSKQQSGGGSLGTNQSSSNSEIGDGELSGGVVRPKRGYSSSPMTYGYTNDNSWDGYPDSYGYPESPGYSKYPPPPLEHRGQQSDRQLLSGPPARRASGPIQNMPQAPISHRRPPQPPPLLSSQPIQASQNPFLNPALLAQALTAVMSQWSQSSEVSEAGSSNMNGHLPTPPPHQPPIPTSKSSSSSTASAYQFPSQQPGSYFGAGSRSPFAGGGSTPNNNNNNNNNNGYQPF